MKKLLALLLALISVLSAVVSCTDPVDNGGGDGTDGGAVNGTDGGDTVEEVLEIPDEKFNGEEFVILVNENYSWNFAAADFDEPSDDALANALYQRNLAVEEMLGITISQKTADTYDSIATDFKTAAEASDSEAFDVAFMNLLHCGTQVGAGNCWDLGEFQYIDLEKSWWDQSSVEQLTIGGKNYMVGGEALYSDKELLWLIFFTKDMITENGLENPYDLVRENK